MRSLLVGVALLAVAAPVAHAQQADEPTAAAVSGQAEPGTFLVYFGFNKATLDASARQVVAEAADEYKRTGAAQITVTGYADKAGRAEYNQRLSERRAEAVRRELERLGVPSSAITVAAEGENDPAVPPRLTARASVRPARPGSRRRCRERIDELRGALAAGGPGAASGGANTRFARQSARSRHRSG